jgi:hypothetical protein
MKFEETYFSKGSRYSIGVESTSARYYASIPVSNGIVDYEEHHELNEDQYREFLRNGEAATEFVEACRRQEHDNLLLHVPGSNRGIPV